MNVDQLIEEFAGTGPNLPNTENLINANYALRMALYYLVPQYDSDAAIAGACDILAKVIHDMEAV